MSDTRVLARGSRTSSQPVQARGRLTRVDDQDLKLCMHP